MIGVTTNASELHTRYLEGAARMVTEIETLQRDGDQFTWLGVGYPVPNLVTAQASKGLRCTPTVNAAWLIANALQNARELSADPDLERRCWAVADRVGLRSEVEDVIAEGVE